MAALASAQLSLSYQLATTVHGGGFHEFAVHGSGGHVVIYAAGGWSVLMVLAGPDVNVGRLHLESRPTARSIAYHLSATDSEEDRTWKTDRKDTNIGLSIIAEFH